MRDLAAADALEAKPSRGCRPGQPGVPEAFAAPSWRAGLKTMSWEEITAFLFSVFRGNITGAWLDKALCLAAFSQEVSERESTAMETRSAQGAKS